MIQVGDEVLIKDYSPNEYFGIVTEVGRGYFSINWRYYKKQWKIIDYPYGPYDKNQVICTFYNGYFYVVKRAQKFTDEEYGRIFV